MASVFLSIAMLGVFALAVGAVLLWRRGVRKQAGLMIVAALVLLANVLIWTVPAGDGISPADRAAGEGALQDDAAPDA
ncbi:hypothetical protein PF049_05965 [Erythrobacteraceae bacterium WH01K]|nr:hypothetical protein PF049_05965 [Erythrobacteraceae bacterium WH01K]